MKISNYVEKWKYKIICSLSGFPSTSGKNKTQANKQSYYEQGQLYGVWSLGLNWFAWFFWFKIF